ncbi:MULTISPECIES: Rv3235 family protein [Arthrobacter]|uniref:Rv3235 family protein n=1 Tax=Arthrobacter TaxID=1663 RepID=UPI001F2790FA|nr:MULTISPECIES: Rv3235 family protein [Arthrobacter]
MTTSALLPLPDSGRKAAVPVLVPSAAPASPLRASLAKNRSGEPSDVRPSSAPAVPKVLSLDREIRTLARSIAQAVVEVLAGTRPAQQLSRSLEPSCYASLQHRAALTRAYTARIKPGQSRLHRSPVVRSVRICAVKDGVYEASSVVAEELRSRAVAMRLERGKDAWKVTALEIG